MTTAAPLARYGAIEGALTSGFATAELHHLAGNDRSMTKAVVGVCKMIVNVRGRDRSVAERYRDLVDFVHHITSGIETGHNGSLMRIHNKVSEVVASRPEVDSKLSSCPASHRRIDRIECGGRSAGE
ncbi:hypothetical protein O7A05_27150 [Mesorhizobium sp. Cs1330R2N1]|uniref:Uncharacterized protein n=1 Tax=Mesorhizobium argentiipisi TaxID=3015175 RepID=A0ABU8KLG2_9HYPH